jgi:hypothetical protein
MVAAFDCLAMGGQFDLVKDLWSPKAVKERASDDPTAKGVEHKASSRAEKAYSAASGGTCSVIRTFLDGVVVEGLAG